MTDRSNRDRKKRKASSQNPLSPEQNEKIARLRAGEAVYITVCGERYLCHQDIYHLEDWSQELVLAPFGSRHYLAVTSPYQSKSSTHVNLTDGTCVSSHQYHKIIHVAYAWRAESVSEDDSA